MQQKFLLQSEGGIAVMIKVILNNSKAVEPAKQYI